MILRVRPEQVSKLLRYIADVGAASERECIVWFGSGLRNAQLYCWRRYNFRDAQFVVFVGAASETRGCIVDISTAADKQLYGLHIYSLRNRWLYC